MSNESQEKVEEARNRFIARVAESVGLTYDRLMELFGQDDDWSLVIRSSAMIEAAVNQGLLRLVQPAKAAEALAKRPLGERLTLARDLGMLPADVVQAARVVSVIRNSVVHDMRAFTFSLDGYLAEHPSADNEVLRPLAAQRTGWERDVEHFRQQPRFAVWLTALHVASLVAAPTWKSAP